MIVLYTRQKGKQLAFSSGEHRFLSHIFVYFLIAQNYAGVTFTAKNHEYTCARLRVCEGQAGEHQPHPGDMSASTHGCALKEANAPKFSSVRLHEEARRRTARIHLSTKLHDNGEVPDRRTVTERAGKQAER